MTQFNPKQSYDEWLAESSPSLSRYFNRAREYDWLDDAANPPVRSVASDAERAEVVRLAHAARTLSNPCIDPDEVQPVYTAIDRPPVLDSEDQHEISAARALSRFEAIDALRDRGRITGEQHLELEARIEKSTGFWRCDAEVDAARSVDEWTRRQNRLDVEFGARCDETITDYDEKDDTALRTRRGVAGEHAWTLEVLSQLRIDWASMRAEAMRARGCDARTAASDPQVLAIARHAESMRHRFNFRRYVAALASQHISLEDSDDRASLIFAQQLALVEAWRRKTRRSYATACEVLGSRVDGIRDRWVGVESLICATPKPAVRTKRSVRFATESRPTVMREQATHATPRVRGVAGERCVATVEAASFDRRAWYYAAADRARLREAGVDQTVIENYYRERELLAQS